MQVAHDRQKSYADLKRKPMEFQVRDRVMLKVSPWKGVVHFCKWGKLNPRVHNTFHVSKLKKCHFDEPLAVPLEGLHVDDKLRFVEEPVEIMDQEVKWLKKSRIPIVKVRWNSRRGPEFTWEREDQFQKKYPHLFTKPIPSSKSIKIRDFPSTDVKIDEWRKLCDHFTSEKHLKHSRSSKVNRSKQLYSSNQGTKSYEQSRYEEFNEETNEFPDLIDHFRAKHLKGEMEPRSGRREIPIYLDIVVKQGDNIKDGISVNKMIELREAQEGRYTPFTIDQIMSQVLVPTLLNPSQFIDVVQDPLEDDVAIGDGVAPGDGVSPGDGVTPGDGVAPEDE
ncbi:hypothetical protein Tco_0963329 [Tanacetum coccineum]